MARPRKLSAEEMLRIVDAYFEGCGDPERLKYSLIEEYAVSIGVEIKAYDFRREPSVRRRMEELRSAPERNSPFTASYKSMDVDALLNRNHTREGLKNSLLEIDGAWRLVYERAAEVSKKNKELMVELLSKSQAIKTLSDEKGALESRVQTLERGSNALLLENRYLKKSLREYLYPAIANEILKNEGSIKQADTEVTPAAMTALADTDVPAPFSKSIENDRRMLSREENLLRGMADKINGGEANA